MRARFSDEAEKGREVGDEYPGSQHGDKYGLFWFTHPRTGQRLKVVVCCPVVTRGINVNWDHVSVSSERCVPTWDEMCWVKRMFFDLDECVVQFHPRASDYINDHPNCLHMWRWTGGDFPVPPRMCV